MTIIPSSLSRVPTLLSSQLVLSNVNRTNVGLFGVQQQIASGLRITRPSDDPVAGAMIATLKARAGQGEQRGRNLDHAAGVLDRLDNSLTSATDLVREAQTIALSQIGLTSDPTTRQQQAIVVDSLIAQLKTIANTKVNGVYVFGGTTPSSEPIEALLGGYRYTARGGAGMLTDLGTGDAIPITLGGENAIGEISARLRSRVPLNPDLAMDTPLNDVRGARGLGITPGSVNVSINGGPPISVNLSTANSISDVANTLTTSIRAYEAANSVTVLGPGGVSVGGGSLTFDIAGGATLDFTETANGITAADLGLSAAQINSGNNAGLGLDPKLRMATRLSDVPALTLPLGSIRLRLTQGQAGAGGVGTSSVIRDIDLSGAQSLDDVRSQIESSGLGVRLVVDDNGRTLNLFSEVAGVSLSVEEVPGNNGTASALGLRTMDWSTPINELNGGRGVRIANGAVNPVTGLPDPTKDTDFRITLGNGQSFDVDLRPQDLVNVQSIVTRINSQFAAAVVQPPINTSAPALAPGQFVAQLTDGPTGIALTQTVGVGSVSVSKLNNSDAADDLGFTSGTWDASRASLIGADRGAIRVDNLFTHLMDLAAALRTNNDAGIAFAGGKIQEAADRLSAAQARVGASAQRVDQAQAALDEQATLDEKLRSQLQDTDYYEAASRFSLLQTQLQASMQTAGQIATSRTLLDFLS